MNKRYLLPILAVSVMTVTGCSTVNKSHTYAPLDVSLSSALEADLDVDTSRKVMGTSTAGYLLGFIKTDGDAKFADGYGGNGRVGTVKSAAAYNAIQSGNGDVLIAPQYNVRVKNYLVFTRITVDVEGYRGKITSINKRQSVPLPVKPY